MIERRTMVVLSLASVALVGAWLITAIPLFAFGQGAPHHGLSPIRIVVTTIAVTVAMAWGYYFATLAHRRLDEFQRARAKTTASWGVALGIGVSAPIYIFIAMGGLHWVDPQVPTGRDLANAFVLGYALPIFGAILGWIVVEAWWRLAKR